MVTEDPESLIGRRVSKLFEDGCLYDGTVVEYDSDERYWLVEYDDGDREEYEEHEIKELVLPAEETGRGTVAGPKKRGRGAGRGAPAGRGRAGKRAASGRSSPAGEAKRVCYDEVNSESETEDFDEGELAAVGSPQAGGRSSDVCKSAGKEALSARQERVPGPSPATSPASTRPQRSSVGAVEFLVNSSSPSQGSSLAPTSVKAVLRPLPPPPQPERPASERATVRVCLPMPLDVLTRHHDTCACTLCKQKIAKGKVKGPLNSRKEYVVVEEIGCEEDVRLQNEERSVPAVVSNGARWAWEQRHGGVGRGKSVKGKGNGTEDDILQRDLDWRKLLTFEERVVGDVQAPKRVMEALGVGIDVLGVRQDASGALHCTAPGGGAGASRQKAQRTVQRYREVLKDAKKREEERKQAAGGVREDGKAMSGRPDLVAAKVMETGREFACGHDKSGKPTYSLGVAKGVAVGDTFWSRSECRVVGLHSHWLSGIATQKVRVHKADATVASAIVMSGGYEDDLDGGDRFPYTGAGGHDLLHTALQIADQEVGGNSSNKALALACDLQVPVRVVRGVPDPESYTKKSYTYDGLYGVTSYWLEVGVRGYWIVKYMLERLPGQPPVATASVHFGLKGSTALPKDQRARDRPGFVMEDISLGQEAKPVCVVNAFDKKSPHWAPAPVPLVLPGASGAHLPSDVTAALAPHSDGSAFVYLGGQSPEVRSRAVPTPAETPPPSEKELRRLNNGSLPYNDAGVLVRMLAVVYEGGPGSGQDVTQRGLRHRLEVFRTEGKGWGVRSWDPVRAGEFVCVFTGEVLTHEEAEARGEHEHGEGYEGEGEYDEYMFNLALSHPAPLADLLAGTAEDPGERDHPEPARVKQLLAAGGLSEEDASVAFELDGRRAGSVARFVNSSDQPNMYVQMVVPPGHRDLRQARICLFALHDIPPLTELTYDYGVNYRENILCDNYRERLMRGSR